MAQPALSRSSSTTSRTGPGNACPPTRSGGILASAHLATARFVELAEAWRAGAIAPARALGHRLAAMSGAMFAEPNPTVIKAVLHAQGRIPTAAVRLPLLPAGAGTVQSALQFLAA